MRTQPDFGSLDRRLLIAIARQHGHGPRRPLALLDIAKAETGSEVDARAALQRLVMGGLIDLGQSDQTSSDCIGWLSDAGAALLGYV
jgi:hypothetical protein